MSSGRAMQLVTPPTPAVSLADFEARARASLDNGAWDFIAGGSGSEWTCGQNQRIFERFCLRPSVLVDVSSCDTSLELLGAPLPVPFGVAPMALHGLAAADGELATVRGAAESGCVVVVSIMASQTLEEIAAAASSPLWFQTYWLRHRTAFTKLVRQAEELGYQALVLTVDLPRMGRRRRDLRNNFALPAGLHAPNLVDTDLQEATAGSSAPARHTSSTFDAAATWRDVAWVRSLTELPLVLKGLLTAEDARLAVEHGVDAVVVSNHGGRQLDGVLPALAALAEVVDAVGTQTEVLMDGGVRSGSDVLKALALGAKAVFVGRPILWGLAADGEDGVRAVLSILRDELDNAMALAGRPTLSDVDSSLICRAPT